MEKEVEIELNYPDELFAFLKEQISKATYLMQKESYQNVLNWIQDRRIVDIVIVDVEPKENDWRD